MSKDVVVVGLGGFGSAALWRLAERGVAVAGVERHGIGHHLGSSHGATRLFRIACQDHPGLAAVALKSLELWNELGTQVGERLVSQTGCLSVGSPDSQSVRGAIAAAAAAGAHVRELSHAELVARQPQYAGLVPAEVAVWDAGAGICYPERDVRAQTAAARRLGADAHPHTMVDAIEADSYGVTIRTATIEWRASRGDRRRRSLARLARARTTAGSPPDAAVLVPAAGSPVAGVRAGQVPGLYLGSCRRAGSVGSRVSR